MSTATIARARASTSHYQNAGQGVNNGTKHYGWGSVSNQDHMVENGYHASAWARAGFKDDRFVAAAGASAGVVKLHMKGHHSVTVNNLGSIGAGYEFFSGSYVGAEGNLSIGRDGVSANVSGGAFAGTTYGINASAEVLGVGAEASAGWVVGVGAKGSAHASFKDGKLSFGVNGTLALGIGVHANLNFSVDFKKMWSDIKGIGKAVGNLAKKGFNALVDGAKAVGSGIAKAAKAVSKA